MNHGPLIFLAAFFALAGSWFGLVLRPHMQVGHMQPTKTVPAGVTYPVSRPGLAREGLEVYRANGCAYCHSQQVGQSATVCDVILTDAGTNQTKLVSAIQQVRPGVSDAEARQWFGSLPKTVLQGVKKETAAAAVDALKVGDAKVELWIVPVGPDIARGWGKRRSVAEDFLYDYPVMPGAQRIGPDLANVGLRLSDANWHLRHLYAPGLEMKDSTMPPYRFLFERRKIQRGPSPEALVLPANLAPPPGDEIVPKPQARALVAYLTSLRADAPLFVAPMTVPPAPEPTTNAPAASGTGTNVASTNTAAKPFTAEELKAAPKGK
jgi:cbb3-type cytochrome oxidase cytochrome c subunit